MHIALVGWCALQDVHELLHPGDASLASGLVGTQTATAVSALARGLIEAGHEVTLVTTDARVEGNPIDLVGPNFHLAVWPARGPRQHLPDLYAVERRGMAKSLRAASPDIVHAHWTYEFELAAQDSGLPHVTTARDAPWTILRHIPNAYSLARLGVAWRARPGIEHLLVASPYMVDAWRGQMLYRREITVIPNMAPHLPTVERVKADVPTAICIADSSPRKNIDGLVRSFSAVRSTVPDARLRLVGPGLGESDPMAVRLASDGLTEGIEFLGSLGRGQLAVELTAAWCLVHPSLEESFGNTLVEAMMLGTPVIGGRDSGAVAWVLGHGRAGQLVDVTSSAALAEALISLLSSDPPAPPPGARRIVETRYSRERIVELHVAEYRKFLLQRQRRRT